MILWQTGEPPTGVELLIEYRLGHGRDVHYQVFRNVPYSMIKILRWSTLDAAPDVLGKLEAILRRNEHQWISLDIIDGQFEAVLYSAVSDKDDVEYQAPTLAAAIQKLCGGTDGP